MNSAYRPLQEALERYHVSTELTRPCGGSVSVKVFYSSVSNPPNYFYVRRSQRGWIVSAGIPHLLPDKVQIVDVCVALAARAEPVESIVRRFGLEKWQSWSSDEAAARRESWKSLGWREHTDEEHHAACDDLKRRLNFPSDELSTPHPSVTWDLSFFYDDDLYAYDEAVSQLNLAGLVSFRKCLSPGEELMAINWQHCSYSLALDGELRSGDLDLWPITIFGDGDVHGFFSTNMQCGISAHPYGNLTVFGEQLPEVMASQLAKVSFANRLKTSAPSSPDTESENERPAAE